MLNGLELRADAVNERRKRIINRQGARSRMIEDVFNLTRRDAEVDGHDTGAHLRHTVIELEEAMAVERQHGNAVAATDA